MDRRPIGVFDSGLGGLTAVRELQKRLPTEDIIYFGDTGRVPYGNRSAATLREYAAQDCRFLLKQDVKYIIAACGTVSSTAGDVLSALPVPATGVVAPTAAAAARATKNGRIGVIATAATIGSGAFERALLPLGELAVFPKACPLFVPLVEAGMIAPSEEATRLIVRRYLLPLKAEGIDTLILGCTHFPLLAPLIDEVMEGTATLIDAGRETVCACAEELQSRGLLTDRVSAGQSRFYVSDRPEGFVRVADMFLGRPVEGSVTCISMDELTG